MLIDPIPLYGPSITHREVELAAQAGSSGWNYRAAQDIRALQQLTAKFVGQRYAHATSSGSAALHLSLLALGCGPGHEVLVPETTDISVAAAVVHTGATPVFCDVDPLTLCLSPAAAAARVTPRTRGMIAVHMYGQPCDMNPLHELANRHKLVVVEDLTQGLGAVYRRFRTGVLGHCSVLSFGAKGALAAGEGGMVLTQSKELHERLVQIGDNGRNSKNPFFSNYIGFNYRMANVAAAVARAQMERIEELLEIKRKIFQWYAERLHDLPGIRLNTRMHHSRNSFWMPVIFIDDPSLNRNDLLKRLLASRVFCEPTPYPLSSMPMFVKADNPVAYGAGLRGVVLPGGYSLTEEEVDYTAAAIRQLVLDRSLPSAAVQPHGWLRHKTETVKRIRRMKRDGFSLPFTHDGEEGCLRLLDEADTSRQEVIDLLVRWRNENQEAFLTRATATEANIRDMMAQYPEKSRTYLFFFIILQGRISGHVALDYFNSKKRECVVESLIMEPDAKRGLAGRACRALYAWLKEEMGIDRVFAHVLASNHKSRLLGAAEGFSLINQTPLVKKTVPNGELLLPMYIPGHDKPDDYFAFSAKDL